MNTKPMFTAVQAMRAALVPTAALVLTLLASTTVQAQVTQITSSQLTATNTANFTDPVGLVSNPYVVMSSGSAVSLTFTNNRTSANNNNFNRINQQGTGAGANDNFAGDFAPGTHLLRNTVTGGGVAGAMTITFSNAVSAIGFNYEPTANGSPDTFTFNIFQGTTLSTIVIPGVTNNDNEDGTAPFFGVRATNGSNSITSVQVFATISDDFVVSPMGVNIAPAATTPEPGAVALLTGAMLPLGLLAARRRRR